MEILSDVARASGRSADDLSKVWREPSFSIANISSSGTGNKTVIPKRVSADISLRIVPDQDCQEVVDTLKAYCSKVFADLGSPNRFEVGVFLITGRISLTTGRRHPFGLLVAHSARLALLQSSRRCRPGYLGRTAPQDP